MTLENINLSPGKSGNNLAMVEESQPGIEYVTVSNRKDTDPIIIREKGCIGEIIESVIIEFPLNRKSYDWFVEYCELKGTDVRVTLTDVVNQYFGAFSDGHDILLFRDFRVDLKKFLLQKKGKNPAGIAVIIPNAAQERDGELLPWYLSESSSFAIVTTGYRRSASWQTSIS
ncbi:MAG: hypothetical protein ACXAEU_05575 [Candidatus Hodarchaeales archaeon]|jgi:hypothetical protein